MENNQEESTNYELKKTEQTATPPKTEEPVEEKFEVIVKGLSYSSTEDDIKDHFGKFGNVVRVNLLTRHDGKSKGTGFVGFETEEEREAAIADTGADFMGRQIWIEKTRPRGERDTARPRRGQNNQRQTRERPVITESKLVFFGNLSYQSTRDGLWDWLEESKDLEGQIAEVRIVEGSDGRKRGFAFVEFTSCEVAKLSLQYNGENFDGRDLRVELAAEKKPERNGGRRRY